MKKFFILLFALSFLFLISCDNSYKISFEEEFPKRKKDIRWKLGDKFMIKNAKDTSTYFVYFQPETRTNFIISEKGDTIFKGFVSKYRGLFYFSYLIKDNEFLIYAVDIKSGLLYETNKIKAFNLMFEQISMLEKEIKTDDYKKLISNYDSLNKVYTLKPDEVLLSKFYTSVLDSFAYDTLILETDLMKNEIVEQIKSTADSLKSDVEELGNQNEKIIASISPNPFSHTFKIIMTYESDFEYEIFNSASKLVKSGSFTGQSIKVLSVDLRPDTYVVKVIDVENCDFEIIKAVKIQAM